MFKTRNQFKQSILRREPQVGCFLSLASPTSTEIASSAGFDWVMIDMEHAPNEVTDVLAHLRAIGSDTCEPMVRVPWNDPIVVKRVLDIGARTILFPYVSSAEEARHAVAATRYPPRGIRGFAGGTRATGYGRIKDYAARTDEDICVIVQVESPEAIDAIAEIGAVEGVDGIFIGPNDLATNMGFLGNVMAPEVKAMIAKALDAIEAAGKPSGILSLNDEGSHAYFARGCAFIGVTSDGFILGRQTERVVAEFARVKNRS